MAYHCKRTLTVADEHPDMPVLTVPRPSPLGRSSSREWFARIQTSGREAAGRARVDEFKPTSSCVSHGIIVCFPHCVPLGLIARDIDHKAKQVSCQSSGRRMATTLEPTIMSGPIVIAEALPNWCCHTRMKRPRCMLPPAAGFMVSQNVSRTFDAAREPPRW